jgi:hypothetical protein
VHARRSIPPAPALHLNDFCRDGSFVSPGAAAENLLTWCERAKKVNYKSQLGTIDTWGAHFIFSRSLCFAF